MRTEKGGVCHPADLVWSVKYPILGEGFYILSACQRGAPNAENFNPACMGSPRDGEGPVESNGEWVVMQASCLFSGAGKLVNETVRRSGAGACGSAMLANIEKWCQKNLSAVSASLYRPRLRKRRIMLAFPGHGVC